MFSCLSVCGEAEEKTQIVFSQYKPAGTSKTYVSTEHKKLEDFEQGESQGITKTIKSPYELYLRRARQNNRPFYDHEFPPEDKSIGQLPSRTKRIVWKRIRDIVKDPIFRDQTVNEINGLISNSQDCYLFPTIITLIQKQGFDRIFGTRDVNHEGIYMVRVNYMGTPEQIIIDDYFPIYQSTGQLVFARPRQNRQIWEMIIEKVWAKIKGGYSNIHSGLPHDVLTAFSHAPCFYLDLKNEKANFVWLQMVDATLSNFPVVASSRRDLAIDCGINPSHCYCVLGSYELQAQNTTLAKIIILVNPTENEQFNGQYSPSNHLFWDSINLSLKNRLKFGDAEQGFLFYLSYQEFTEHFDSVDICHLRPLYNYNFETVTPQKRSSFVELELYDLSEVYLTLYQKPVKPSSNMDIYGRMSILLARVVADNYEFVASKLEVSFPNLSIRCPDLQPGRYIVYAKCYNKHKDKMVLSVYSQRLVTMKTKIKQQCQSFLQRVFLSHAFMNTDKNYIDGEDWVCCKLLYNQGGFAYVAAHVKGPNKKKIMIEWTKRDFEDAGLKIKEPYSGMNSGRLVAEAAKPAILVCRLADHPPNKITFPPKLSIFQTI